VSSYPAPLTPNQVNLVFQSATIAALGIALQSPAIANDPAYAAVRVGWQQQGQPAFGIDEDVVFVRCAEDDDQYDRIKHPSVVNGQQLFQYTRVWRVWWDFHGPNSVDRGRILRSALFSQATHDALSAAQLYLVTNPQAPQRLFEEKDGQWWERVNFSAQFNEMVTETPPVAFASSVEIIGYTAQGQFCDITVEES
jgi:hypothetical protein